MPAKVLVADDSPTIRRRATTTLSEAGYDVTCVEDGQAAWNLLQSGGPGAFAVLLADILMPGIDGYELCRRVKSDAAHASLPVLLLRGTFEPWDQAKAVDAGADGYVTKPFDAEALLSTLGEVMAETGGAAPAAAAAGAGPAPAASSDADPFGAPEAAPAPEWAPASAAAPEPAPAPVVAAADPMAANPFELASDDEPSPEDTAVFAPEPPAASDDVFGDGGVAPTLMGEPPPVLSPPVGDAGEPLGAMIAEPLPSHETPQEWAPTDRQPVAPPIPSPTPSPLDAEPLRATAGPLAAAPPRPPLGSLDGSLAGLDEATLDRIAERVAARLVGRDLERIAWEVVPDVAEAVIRRRLSEIEAQLGED